MESTADSPTPTRSDENMRHDVILRFATPDVLWCDPTARTRLHPDRGPLSFSVPNKRAEPAKARPPVPPKVRLAGTP